MDPTAIPAVANLPVLELELSSLLEEGVGLGGRADDVGAVDVVPRPGLLPPGFPVGRGLVGSLVDGTADVDGGADVVAGGAVDGGAVDGGVVDGGSVVVGLSCVVVGG